MIYSMTAFARQSSQLDWGTLVWEIRSVNHRYLEPHFKLPDIAKLVEGELREYLRKTLNRGKVECSLRIQSNTGNDTGYINVNQPLLIQLISVADNVQKQLRKPARINPIDLLKWPGVIEEQLDDSDIAKERIIELFQVTVQQLLDSRKREGTELKAYIEQRLNSISGITVIVRKQLPEILNTQRQKLTERLQELKVELNAERLEQEIVMLAQKADVDEELDRLDTHVSEVRRILNKGGVCGRRLDFLMQELNREANTLSSKSIVSDTTAAAVELKVLIEQMREQIQNIE